MRRRIFQGQLMLVLLALILAPSQAQAVPVPVDKLPPARIVAETRADLAQRDCSEQSYDSALPVVDAPPGKPYRVQARDATVGTLHYCSAAAAGTLTIVSGATAGVLEGIEAIREGAIDALMWSMDPNAYAIDLLTGGVTKDLRYFVGRIAKDPLSSPAIITTAAANAITDVGTWVFDVAFNLVMFSLTPSTFITNPLVAKGWPVVQGIANVGFLVALLFIAFTTTLNLDVGGGIKKLLPRLFIAALLINFSLVFAGVILDITKVLMAIMVSTMAGTSMSGIEALIYKNSAIFEIMSNIDSLSIPSTNDLVVAIVKMILTWSLALAMLALGIGLLIRYIMLIVLLIISPLAYLAFAFPAADALGKRWWGEFFKYAFYGPIALFFLALATRVGELGFKVVSSSDGVAQALNAAVMSGMLIAAAVYAKQAGGTFSVATINFLQGSAKRRIKGAVGIATYVPRRVGKGIGKVVEAQGEGAAKALFDYGKARMGFDPRSKKPFLQKKVEEHFPPLTKTQKNATANAKRDVQAAVVKGAMHGPADVRTANLAPTQLQQKHIVQDMTEEEIRFLVTSGNTTFAQKEKLLSNPEAIKKLQTTGAGNTLIQHILTADTNNDRPTNLNTNPAVAGSVAAARANQTTNETNARANAAANGNQSLIKAFMAGFEKLNNLTSE